MNISFQETTTKTQTNVICVVCERAQIIKESYIPYIPAVSATVIGPGSRNVATEADRVVDGYYCPDCGVTYKTLPKTGKRMTKAPTTASWPPQIQDRINKGAQCGSAIGSGWLPLVKDLDKKIAKIEPNYVIDQIKEKFAGLRFYAANIELEKQAAVDILIQMCENESYKICEECGAPGEQVSIKGWLKTRCNDCRDYQTGA